MPMTIVRNDITTMKVDAIVNAANAGLRMGGGVCGAIFNAAGPEKLQAACDRYGQCAPGQAVITDGFALPSRFVIHTVGPIWAGGAAGEEQTLRDCYTNSLRVAAQHQLTSIAFPLISSGIFGYPVDQALQVALAAITAFLLEHDMDVYLVVFDKRSFKLSGQLYADVKSYIDETLVDTYAAKNRGRRLSDEMEFLSVIVQEPSAVELYNDIPHAGTKPARSGGSIGRILLPDGVQIHFRKGLFRSGDLSEGEYRSQAVLQDPQRPRLQPQEIHRYRLGHCFGAEC